MENPKSAAKAYVDIEKLKFPAADDERKLKITAFCSKRLPFEICSSIKNRESTIILFHAFQNFLWLNKIRFESELYFVHSSECMLCNLKRHLLFFYLSEINERVSITYSIAKTSRNEMLFFLTWQHYLGKYQSMSVLKY